MSLEEVQQTIEQLKELIKTSEFNVAKALAFELIEVVEIQNDAESLAKLYNSIGSVYSGLSKFQQAIEYYEKSLQIFTEIGSRNGIAKNLGNIGIVYFVLSEYPKSLDFYFQALQIYEEIGNKEGIATILGNIGNVYSIFSEFSKSIEYYQKSLLINEEIESKEGVASILGNLGIVYAMLSQQPIALEYYGKALSIFEEIGIKEGISINLSNIGKIYQKLSDFPKALEYGIKALKINEEIENYDGVSNNLGFIGNVYRQISDYQKSIEYLEIALQMSLEIGSKTRISTILLNIGITYKELFDFNKAIEFVNRAYIITIETEVKFDQMLCLEQFAEVYEKMGDIETAFSYYKQFIALKVEINSVESTKKATLFDQRRKIEEDEKARQLKLARFQEQERLLHNILPINIANRILKQELFIADHFESVSVMFMDLVGFTKLSSIAPPKQLVYLLDTIFTKADEIIERYGLEKIKTIGDGYMAVANVTTPLDNHPEATALASLELLQGMKDLVVSFPKELGDSSWTQNMNDIEIRIGIHTGEVVAGIIGKNKYTFDLWGDAVNVASRMESHSEPWKIHISDQFAKSIESNTKFKIIPRGEILIKGKGQMNTYWLEKAI